MFKKYNSIENSYRQKFIDKVMLTCGNDEFVVTEKIHGANFSFWISGNGEIDCAKRNGFIDEDTIFYNHDAVLNKFKDKLLKLFSAIKLEGGSELVLYGEIFGGNYPHKDIPKLNVKKVQTGVFYSNDIEFIAFDIMIDGKLINHNRFTELCKKNEIPTAPEVFRGNLTDCLNYKNDYQSKVPEILGLPTIENNICEGNVIKPVTPKFLPNNTRVIIKNKNDKFSEKKVSKKVKTPKTLPDHVQNVVDDVDEFINENRLRNVISKIGTITNKDFGKLLGLFNKDVLTDFNRDNEYYEHLEDSERKIVNKNINKECANLIRKHFLNIIDGEF